MIELAGIAKINTLGIDPSDFKFVDVYCCNCGENYVFDSETPETPYTPHEPCPRCGLKRPDLALIGAIDAKDTLDRGLLRIDPEFLPIRYFCFDDSDSTEFTLKNGETWRRDAENNWVKQ